MSMDNRNDLNPNVYLAGCTDKPESFKEFIRYAIYGLVMAGIFVGCAESILRS